MQNIKEKRCKTKSINWKAHSKQNITWYSLLIYLQYFFFHLFLLLPLLHTAASLSCQFFYILVLIIYCLGFFFVQETKTTINSISTTIRSYVQNLIKSRLRTRKHSHTFTCRLSFFSFSTLLSLVFFLPLFLICYRMIVFMWIFSFNFSFEFNNKAFPCAFAMQMFSVIWSYSKVAHSNWYKHTQWERGRKRYKRIHMSI